VMTERPGIFQSRREAATSLLALIVLVALFWLGVFALIGVL
jgi:hypothetical protein